MSRPLLLTIMSQELADCQVNQQLTDCQVNWMMSNSIFWEQTDLEVTLCGNVEQ